MRRSILSRVNTCYPNNGSGSRTGPFLPPVDKPGDPALRILPYGYGPAYVVGALVAAGEIGR
ncbi:hypothetical protein F2Q68_00015256 [Brassica cretica]|uniref:Uncharacterized protein n=1 Tax=Brassica cretica TaxID=69181 RepID=A0A8S9HNU2_BRACR|nr:hypothetical protein F2Q68_00015256 [Brassica cretica]